MAGEFDANDVLIRLNRFSAELVEAEKEAAKADKRVRDLELTIRNLRIQFTRGVKNYLDADECPDKPERHAVTER